ncbi:MAG: Smr/MutS family protein [Gammaproteobacteria bacterium]
MSDKSDSDKRLFRDAVRGTRRIKDGKVHHEPQRPEPSARFTRADAIEVLEQSLCGESSGDAVADDGMVFRRSGVRDKTVRKLKRGQLSIQDELDLHGLTSAEAYDALKDFVRSCVAHRLQCVRIIHGKGYRSGHRGPVLKRQVGIWLRRFDEVLAFCPARPADGGDGAVYLLLKKTSR